MGRVPQQELEILDNDWFDQVCIESRRLGALFVFGFSQGLTEFQIPRHVPRDSLHQPQLAFGLIDLRFQLFQACHVESLSQVCQLLSHIRIRLRMGHVY